MQKSCRVSFMYGELTDKNTIDAIDEALETHQTEQFEILLYKKNRKTIIIIPLLGTTLLLRSRGKYKYVTRYSITL